KAISINPGDSVSIPLRIKIPFSASSEINYKVELQLFTDENQLLSSRTFDVKTRPVHDWDVQVPQKRLYFFPGSDRLNFDIRIINNGNISDTISLDIIPDRKIKLIARDESDSPAYVVLGPHTDTTLYLTAIYYYNEERIFELSKIQIYAKANSKRIYRAVIIEKYSDNYDPFEIDMTLPHQLEAGFRTFNKNSEVLPFIKTNGIAKLGDESSFRYNFTYYDLTQTENIIANSYYNFLYSNNDLRIGLGAFSSMLGRNLYNRNSIMVAHKIRLSKTGSLEGFASYGFTDPKAGGAIGYIYEKNDLNMKASAAYDADGLRKINTASFIYHSNKIKLAKNHYMSAVLYAYNENHYLTNKYSLSGIAWDINYYGRLSKSVVLQFSNNYGSPNMPGPQMGLLNFKTKLNLATSDEKKFFTFKYVNTNKNFYYMSYEGYKLPSSLLHDQFGSIFYHSYSSKVHRWSAGPSMEYYKSLKPISNSDEKSIYSVRKYRIEYHSFIGRYLTLGIKAGMGDIYYKETKETKELRYDFHLLGDLNLGGYGLRFAYDYGPMVNTGIYQFAIDASNNSANISPYAIKQILKGRVNLTLFANFAYRFDLRYGSININPKIEAYVYKDWYVVAGGTYTYLNQEYKGSNIDASYYYTEFSIKKKWGKSDYKKWQKDLRRIKIVFFRDNNGNGKRDNLEEGIPNVKARLLLVNSADQNRNPEFPIDLTLLSNDKGNVIFSRIPMGFYELSITPLQDQKEYFYINKTAENIEVTKTDVLYIPFQKASRIEGKIELSQRKYVLENQKIRDMANIKVTAFNNDGNTYSAFTKKDGSFVLFAPGNNVYFLRIPNVFGKDFRIVKNDLKVELPSPEFVVFKVVEKNRAIRFKQAQPKGGKENQLKKLKILPGKIYKNERERLDEQSPLPRFNIKNKAAEEEIVIKDKFYVVLSKTNDFNVACDIVKLMKENAVFCRIGSGRGSDELIVFTNYYSTKDEAKAEIKRLKASGIKRVEVLKAGKNQ
ncbi:MAG: hypothetical protein GXO88_14400, partial [Chlorobi bacterium]|nr:hypothetical protein [Chlorobiota bacterium]